MDAEQIEALAAQCEEAAVGRISAYFAARRSRAGPDRTALTQADLFLRLASLLRAIPERSASD